MARVGEDVFVVVSKSTVKQGHVIGREDVQLKGSPTTTRLLVKWEHWADRKAPKEWIELARSFSDPIEAFNNSVKLEGSV